MALDYLKIRDMNREVIGIIDTAKSIIWHSVYYGCGDFEIYAQATPDNLSLLQKNLYVTRPDEFDFDIGIIEKIEITNNVQDGTMIVASGRFAKSILDRRLIYKLSGKTNTPTILQGNVEENIRRVVYDNAIDCSFDSRRNIPILQLGPLSNIDDIIVDVDGNPAEKQVSYQNLMEYTDEVLREYGLTSVIYLDTDNVEKNLLFRVKKGVDRSIDNTDNMPPVIFSREYDNLTSSEYSLNIQPEKNVALIGGEGEGIDRFYSLVVGEKVGLYRREEWVDAGSISKTLKASELQTLFPTGVFVDIDFKVGNVVYATLVLDLDREYSLSNLQEQFPSGVVNGTKFDVNGATYANKVYGDNTDYKLTPLGYKAMLDKDQKEGDYTLSDAVYKTMLDTQGKQILAGLHVEEIFDGIIDVTAGNYVLNEDFRLGDIVTVQDNSLGLYVNVRITETIEVMDENGYSVEAKYE